MFISMAFTSPTRSGPLDICIIMEYIDAPESCRNRDYERMARDVDTLIHIEAPSAVPG